MKIGIVSLFGNPVVHLGHIQYINAAKAKSDKLIVVLNNDKQIKLKGGQPFMSEKDRVEFMMNFKSVDKVMLSIDEKDLNLCETLREIAKGHPYQYASYTFYNSGDRKLSDPNNPSPNTVVCQEIGFDKEFIDLPKIYSSSYIWKLKP